MFQHRSNLSKTLWHTVRHNLRSESTSINASIMNSFISSTVCILYTYFWPTVYLCLYFWTANQKTKYFAWNDDKHSLTSICSEILHEKDFDLSRLLQNIWVAPPFQTIYTNLYVVILSKLKENNYQMLIPFFSHLSYRAKLPGRKLATVYQGRIKLFGAPRQWKHFRPLFQAVFLSAGWGGGVLPPRLSQTPRLPVPRQK